MRNINLSIGKSAIVDDEDYIFLSQYNWYVCGKKKFPYAKTWHCGSEINMQHLIMKRHSIEFSEIDHIDRNTLNNQKNNLRPVTRSQNCMNRGPWGESKFKGVSMCRAKVYLKSGIKIYEKWRARIQVNGSPKFIGNYKTEEQAALAYNEAALKYHGEYAVINVI